MRFDYVGPDAVVVLGIPSDEHSSYLRGCAGGPARIREVLASGMMNLCAEDGLDLGIDDRLRDVGDVEGGFERIEGTVAELLDRGAKVLCLGGDHAITYPVVSAYKRSLDRLTILHLDAHPDLYDEFEGDRLSHACPFARIMEEAPAPRLIQVGIRATNPHLRDQSERFGVEVFEMRRGFPVSLPPIEGPLFLSLDLDVLDPSCAPGVAHHEPGGPTTREVIELIQNLRAPLVGADLVELNPDRDPTGITAAAAAKLVKEIGAVMLR